MEDEEHVLFHCPEYDTCQQEYPDLLLGNMSIKNISDFDNQETIAKLLWKIRMIRIKLGADCLILGALKLVFVILFLFFC